MIVHAPLTYHHDNVELEGIFIHDDSRGTSMPGVLLIHEFMGLGEYLIPHGERLARQGYAVLLCDMYGKGIKPKYPSEASMQARIYRENRVLMRSRARAGLDALQNQPMTDQAKLFAVGFSFGGCTALELARSGANLAGTVSFYGYLNTVMPCGPGDVKGRILVLHGAHDRVVPMDEIPVFENEMRKAETDLRLVVFDDAGHGFANATQENDTATGAWYCEETSERAWATVLEFLTKT